MKATEVLDTLATLNPVPDADNMDIDDAAFRILLNERVERRNNAKRSTSQRAIGSSSGWRRAAVAFLVVLVLGGGLAAAARIRPGAGPSEEDEAPTATTIDTATTTTIDASTTTTITPATPANTVVIGVAQTYVQSLNELDIETFEGLWTSNPHDDWTGYGVVRYPADALTYASSLFSIELSECEAVSNTRAECNVVITDRFLERTSDEGPIYEAWAFELDSSATAKLQAIRKIELGDWESPAWDSFALWQQENYPNSGLIYYAGEQPQGQPIEEALEEWWLMVDEYAAQRAIEDG